MSWHKAKAGPVDGKNALHGAWRIEWFADRVR
jgi:hypothetical protein